MQALGVLAPQKPRKPGLSGLKTLHDGREALFTDVLQGRQASYQSSAGPTRQKARAKREARHRAQANPGAVWGSCPPAAPVDNMPALRPRKRGPHSGPQDQSQQFSTVSKSKSASKSGGAGTPAGWWGGGGFRAKLTLEPRSSSKSCPRGQPVWSRSLEPSRGAITGHRSHCQGYAMPQRRSASLTVLGRRYDRGQNPT